MDKQIVFCIVYMKAQDDAQESVAVCWIHATTTLSSGSILSVPHSVWLTSTPSNRSVLNLSWIPESATFCGGWSAVWTVWYIAWNATEATDLRLVTAFYSAWRAMLPRDGCTMCCWIRGIVAVLCSMGASVSEQGILCWCHLLPYHSKVHHPRVSISRPCILV